jgi:inner membrane protein involved in colicin E2 resistance
MSSVSPLKHGFVDLAAVFFVIGGVVSLIISFLAIPISSIYPSFTLPTIGPGVLVTLVVGVVCSLGAIHCYTLTRRRLLSEAGIRGIIFGAVLLILGLGLWGTFAQSGTTALLMGVSAVLILIAGAVCFVLRHTDVSASAIARQQSVVQHA